MCLYTQGFDLQTSTFKQLNNLAVYRFVLFDSHSTIPESSDFNQFLVMQNSPNTRCKL